MYGIALDQILSNKSIADYLAGENGKKVAQEQTSEKEIDFQIVEGGDVNLKSKPAYAEIAGVSKSLSAEENNLENIGYYEGGYIKISVEVMPLKGISKLKLEEGNINVEVDEGEYQKGILGNQFSVVGKLFLKRYLITNTKELKEKLSLVWKISNFKSTPLGGGFYHIFIESIKQQSMIISIGAVNLKPGVFRVSRWMPNFNV